MVPDQHERDLADLVRGLLAAECPPELVRALREPGADRMPSGLWKSLADAGLLGLPFPEELGGSGGSLLDLHVLAVEAGRGLCPTLLHSCLLFGLAVDALGEDRHRSELLPALSSGSLRGTAVVAGPRDAADLRPTVTLEDGRLSGSIDFAPDADLADVLLLTASRAGRTVGVLVRAGAPGLEVEPRRVMGSDRWSRVTLSGVPVAEADLLAGPDGAGLDPRQLRRVANLGVTLHSLDLVGVAQAAIERTVAHTRQREQFGRPIASFQAAQHLVADMHIATQAARLAGLAALERLAAGEEGTRATATARIHAVTAAKRATLDAHQLHGGMGYVVETDLHLWSERARVLSTFGGGADEATGWLADVVVPTGRGET